MCLLIFNVLNNKILEGGLIYAELMGISSAFLFISYKKLYLQQMKKLLLPFLFVGTMCMIFVMGKTGATLITVPTPKGILDLEFAYNKTKVTNIMHAWSSNPIVDNISKAKTNTYLDFIFLAFYSTFLFFACRKITETNKSNFGLYIAKGALLSGGLDIFENIGMLISLSGYKNNIVAFVTTICASIKWVLAILAVLYLLLGILAFVKKIKSIFI